MKTLILLHNLNKIYETETDLTKPVIVEIKSKFEDGIKITEKSAEILGVKYLGIAEQVFYNDEFTIIMEIPDA